MFVVGILSMGLKDVQASSYQAVLSNASKVRINKNYYWLSKEKLYKSKKEDEKGKVIAKKVTSVITNGKNIYYTKAKYTEYGWEPKGKTTVYKKSVTSNKRTKIVKIKKIINLITLDKKKIYFTEANKSIYSMDLKEKKIKRIKVTKDSLNMPWGSSKYIVISEQKWNSKIDKYCHPLKVYNVRTKKMKTVTKEATDYVVQGDYLYYFYRTEKEPEEYDFTANLYGVVYKYNFKTGKRITITEQFKHMNYGEKRVTATHITFDYWNDEQECEESKEIWY